ncbi:MAG: hypothetical protein A2170_12025 [Deltaproteobacteria bacterium RBG_13_53_10]|nr:MAG: hypothetical protein A2170_12025 [Deltaproteobacteria bacterium RBG_13_53_10]
MFETALRILIIMSVLILPVKSFSAETVKLRHVVSVYTDEKGVGMKRPEGVACDGKSLLVVADTGNNRLLQYTFQDRSIKEGKEIKADLLQQPIRVQLNSKGEIFVLDAKQRRVVRLSERGEYKGYLTAEGLPSPSAFVPKSFKIDTTDTIYILDIFSGRVLILSPDGKYQKQVDFPKEAGFFTDLAVDMKGNIFLIDSTKRMLFSFSKERNSFAPLGKSLKEYLNFPASLTVDSRGTIFVVDENGSGIVVLGQDGSVLGRLLTMGWTEGLLYYPTQMCMTEKGDVFIADRGNSRIQVFSVVK